MSRESIDRTDATTRSIVGLLASEACVDVFGAHHVTLEPLPGSAEFTAKDCLTSVIGFSGSGIWGMCMVTSSRAPLCASNPAGGSARDWLAELVNQLAGRLKRKLIEQGATVYITTPIVLRSARVEPLPHHNQRPTVFGTPDGMVELWVEVETAADFKLIPEGNDSTLTEGDSVLF